MLREIVLRLLWIPTGPNWRPRCEYVCLYVCVKGGASLDTGSCRVADSGEGLFALMLEAPDPDQEAADLAERGLNVLPRMAGAGGRDVHPNSTDGVPIRVYPVNSFAGERSRSSSGLSGIMRAVVAVRDLDHARRIYQAGFRLACNAAYDDELRGVRAFICRPPAGGVIEFVTPTDMDRPFVRDVAAFLEDRPGLYALVLNGDFRPASDTVFGARILVERTETN